MSDPVSIFPYACSLGTVLDHGDDGTIYRIQLADGTVISRQPKGAPSPEAVEDDIANPPAPPDDTTAAWLAFLAGSITDPVTGIALKANLDARNDFIGQDALLTRALVKGWVTPDSPQSIWDAANVEHVLTVEGVRDLILRYGIAWQTAFNQLAP